MKFVLIEEVRPENVLVPGNYITLNPDAEVFLSYSSRKKVPKKYISDIAGWRVDTAPDDPDEAINIAKRLDPYTGAYCGYIMIDDIDEIWDKSRLIWKR